MNLYLLRHGQAFANTRGLVTGGSDDILTDFGRQQAMEAGVKLEKLEFAACYVSHWARARQTARLAAPNRVFVVDERLGEIDAGLDALMSRDAFEKAYPEFFGAFNPSTPFRDGESHLDLYYRSREWLLEMAQLYEKEENILAVTHMGTIACILHFINKVPMESFPAFKPGNCHLDCISI